MVLAYVMLIATGLDIRTEEHVSESVPRNGLTEHPARTIASSARKKV